MDVRVLATLGWLLFLLVLAIGYLLRQIRLSPYSLWENCLYAPTFVMGRLMWRVQFCNEPPQELKTGAILVANHRSSMDPFFVQLAAKRRVHWMVAKEFCTHFLFGPVLGLLQVIPTNRSGMDTAATKHAIRITHQGRLVGMFPEGKINTGSEVLLPLRGGAAVVAIRGEAPLVPLLIEGSPYSKQVWGPLFMPAQVRITFGTAVHPQKVDPADSTESEERDRHTPVESDRMMLAIGRQILAMAGKTGEVELASARKRKSRRNRERTD